jgi:hypothetical protein
MHIGRLSTAITGWQTNALPCAILFAFNLIAQVRYLFAGVSITVGTAFIRLGTFTVKLPKRLFMFPQFTAAFFISFRLTGRQNIERL